MLDDLGGDLLVGQRARLVDRILRLDRRRAGAFPGQRQNRFSQRTGDDVADDLEAAGAGRRTALQTEEDVLELLGRIAEIEQPEDDFNRLRLLRPPSGRTEDDGALSARRFGAGGVGANHRCASV